MEYVGRRTAGGEALSHFPHAHKEVRRPAAHYFTGVGYSYTSASLLSPWRWARVSDRTAAEHRRCGIASSSDSHKSLPYRPQLHFQQPLGVAAHDLDLILCRELKFVHPLCSREVLHKGPVHGEQDTVHAQFHHRAEQGRS